MTDLDGTDDPRGEQQLRMLRDGLLKTGAGTPTHREEGPDYPPNWMPHTPKERE